MSRTVPEGWGELPLDSMADYYNGRGFKKHEWGTQGLPIIRIAQMTDPYAATNCYSGKTLDARHHVKDGDILFSWSATLCALRWKWGEGALNQHIFKVIPKDGIDDEFLLQTLQLSIAKLSEESHGSTMKHIKKGTLRTFTAPIPPLPEQKKIAAILNSVDEAISATQAVINQTLKAKEGLLQDIFEFPLADNAIRNSLGFRLREWKLRPVGEVAVVFNGKGIGTGGTQCRVFKTKHVYDGVVRLHSPEYVPDSSLNAIPKESFIKPGDTLTPNMASGTIGRVSVAQQYDFLCVADPQVTIIRPQSEELILPHFIYHFFSSRQGKKELLSREVGSKFGSKRGQTHLYPRDVKAISMPVPTISEQAKVNDLIDPMDSSVRANHTKLLQLQEVKRGLAHDLLSGSVRV